MRIRERPSRRTIVTAIRISQAALPVIVLCSLSPPAALAAEPDAVEDLKSAAGRTKPLTLDAAKTELLLQKFVTLENQKDEAQKAQKAAEEEKKKAEEEKKKAEATKVVANAKKDAALAEVKKKEADSDVAKSNTLLEHGVTGGVATLVQVPLKRDWGQSRIESGHFFDVTPFLVFLPRYWTGLWGGSPEQRRYCATRWTNSELEGQRAADTMAKQRGEVLAADLVARVKAGAGDEARILNDVDESSIRGKMLALAEVVATKTGTTAKVAKAALSGMMAERVIQWVPGKSTSCGLYSIGVWVTPLPASKTLDVRVGRNPGVVKEATAKRWVSFGLAWVPSAYVSILGGVSYGSIDLQTTVQEGQLRTDSVIRYWSFNAGFSVNADAISLLTK